MDEKKNKLTLDDLKEKVVRVQYERVGLKTTVCCLTLANGFEVVGTSAPVSLDNFNDAIGREVAYNEALNKVWNLEGYLLQERMGLVWGPAAVE